jgi:hypothetical protein
MTKVQSEGLNSRDVTINRKNEISLTHSNKRSSISRICFVVGFMLSFIIILFCIDDILISKQITFEIKTTIVVIKTNPD